MLAVAGLLSKTRRDHHKLYDHLPNTLILALSIIKLRTPLKRLLLLHGVLFRLPHHKFWLLQPNIDLLVQYGTVQTWLNPK